MKKLTVLFLTFLYLGTATGVTLHLHYCMGEVVNLEVTKADQGHYFDCSSQKHSGKMLPENHMLPLYLTLPQKAMGY